MSIEVTSEDVREVTRLLGLKYPSNWSLRPVEQVVAAAWAVLEKKQQAIKEAEDKQKRLQATESYDDWCKKNGQFPGG